MPLYWDKQTSQVFGDKGLLIKSSGQASRPFYVKEKPLIISYLGLYLL